MKILEFAHMDRRAIVLRICIVAALAAVALVIATAVTAQETGGEVYAQADTASQAEIEVLRRLLGVPAGQQPEAQREEPAEADEPEPATSFEPAAIAPRRVSTPAPRPARQSRHAAAFVSGPERKLKADTAGSSKTSSSAQQADAPATQQPEPAMQPEEAAASTAPASPDPVPPPGTVVSAANLDQWRHLLGPSVQWSIERGATIDVVAPKPIKLERVRQEATQRYHAQVRLSDDKRSMQNFVAGIPFPLVSEDDPDAAPKLMFNMENRINQDDLDVRNFSCDTGTLDGAEGFSIQRHYGIEHFRRFYHVGRMWVDPKPEWPSSDGARYREMLYPLVEPFDLKGAGFTYIRYLDPNRQDDSWLYFPQLKRVRRLGTAQRSEGVFGQDVDLDSYGGFAGNPAWTSWTFLGKKTILASVHAHNVPSKFEKAPAAFFPDDVWEPREVWVILGISKLGGYNFGRRIIYLDRENWIVPYTEIYDLKGQLWRTLIHTWRSADRPRPDATRAIYEDEAPFIGAFTLIDMQLNHATRCQFPTPEAPGEDGWYYRFGEQEGTTVEAFSVSNFIGGGR